MLISSAFYHDDLLICKILDFFIILKTHTFLKKLIKSNRLWGNLKVIFSLLLLLFLIISFRSRENNGRLWILIFAYREQWRFQQINNLCLLVNRPLIRCHGFEHRLLSMLIPLLILFPNRFNFLIALYSQDIIILIPERKFETPLFDETAASAFCGSPPAAASAALLPILGALRAHRRLFLTLFSNSVFAGD